MENVKSGQFNIYKLSIPKSVVFITLLAIFLNILRIVIWGKMSFFYILWNICLAFIPFFISYTILSLIKESRSNKIILIVGIVLWILFIPNAPYIVTDFIHLGTTRSIPILYDTFLLFSSATVGMILFFESLNHVEQIIQMKLSKRKTSTIIGVIILVISFGMYIGRFLRFNSWDIFINHSSLFGHVWKIFSQATTHKEVYLYTILFFLFLFTFYKAWKCSYKK